MENDMQQRWDLGTLWFLADILKEYILQSTRIFSLAES